LPESVGESHGLIEKIVENEKSLPDDPEEWWRKHVYSDEVYLQIGSGYQRPTVRRPSGPAFEERYLAQNFTKEPMSIQFFAAFSSTGHTSLVPIQKRTKNEDAVKRTDVGYSIRYVNDIIVPHLFPLYESMGEMDSEAQTIEDGASYHTSTYSKISVSEWDHTHGLGTPLLRHEFN
jgi:hypothetical protein